MYKKYIEQLDGGQSTDFAPQTMDKHHEWVRQHGTQDTLYLNVRTSRRGSEFRPLERFSRTPRLDTVVVYSAPRRDAAVRRDDPRLLRAIADQKARLGDASPAAVDAPATALSRAATADGQSLSSRPRTESDASPDDPISHASPWSAVWAAIRQRVMELPRCEEHPEHPHIRTLRHDSVNDVLGTSDEAIMVRSHRTENPDLLAEKTFRQWWDHLLSHPIANIDPGHPNTPSFLRPVLIAPVLLACLPHLIERRGASEISLVKSTRRYLAPSDADVPGEHQPYVPESADTRDVALRAIRIRRGQQQFREALIGRYGPRCMVTGCEVPDVLEAAHIRPYRGENDNQVENGLLLRADLHTLFDLDLFGVGRSEEIELHPSIAGAYGPLVAKHLVIHGASRPSREALDERYVKFRLRCAEGA